jgi:hypothetical protein
MSGNSSAPSRTARGDRLSPRFIYAEQLLKLAAGLANTSYGRYLETVARDAPQQYRRSPASLRVLSVLG